MYSNRSSKRPDPSIAPVVWEVDPAGKKKAYARAPFQPSPYLQAQREAAWCARRRNRVLGHLGHGVWPLVEDDCFLVKP
jgi:hypothetical protein